MARRSRGETELGDRPAPILKRPTTDVEAIEDAQWSDDTLAALDELPPNERTFATYVALGCSSAEAYRRITGREYTDAKTDTTRMGGYALKSKPRVAKAIGLMLKDQNLIGAMNREWILMKLHQALERAEESNSVLAQQVIGELADRIAKLTGQHLETPAVLVQHELSPAAQRFFAAIEMAKKHSQVVVVQPDEATKKPAAIE